MRLTLISIFILVFLIRCYPNDCEIKAVGGTWVVMRGEHTLVQMEREFIVINAYENYYDVTATFIFRNRGDSCTVYMGFPESGTGEGRSGSYFLKFSTTVNEETVDAKRKFVKSEFGGETDKAFWIKQVAFEKGETKKVVVRYRSPFGIGFANTGGSGSIIRYIFSGGNWYGKVKKSTLKIYFHIPSYVYPDEHREIKYESGHYSYERKNWEAEEYFEVVFRKKESEEQNPVS